METKETRKSRFITAAEVAEEVGCSKGHAYEVIKKINDMLEAKGYIVPMSGRTLRSKYYELTGGL